MIYLRGTAVTFSPTFKPTLIELDLPSTEKEKLELRIVSSPATGSVVKANKFLVSDQGLFTFITDGFVSPKTHELLAWEGTYKKSLKSIVGDIQSAGTNRGRFWLELGRW